MILVLGLAFSQAQATTIYTNYASFKTAWTPLIDENFEDMILNGDLTISSDWGGYIDTGIWYDQVGSGGNQTTFTFNNSNGIDAFGGWFNLADILLAGGPGSNIAVSAVDLNGTTYSLGEIANTYVDDFWGFDLDGTAFDQVIFSKGTAGTAQAVETYYSIDIQYSAVPEPTTMVLFGIGLIGIAGIGRKKFIK